MTDTCRHCGAPTNGEAVCPGCWYTRMSDPVRDPVGGERITCAVCGAPVAYADADVQRDSTTGEGRIVHADCDVQAA